MKIGISGVKFLMGNSGGARLTISGFDTSGFFILAYNDFGLSYSGRALAVRFTDE